ncbi:MAG: serine/threonine-protein kinase [Planctomycetota bacterium]
MTSDKKNQQDRFHRSMEIFGVVCELPIGQREAAIAERCGSDVDLRAEVERMLAHDMGQPELFEAIEQGRGLEEVAGGVLEEFADGAASIQVTGYEILREVGRGGMGVIYEARQESPNRRVALKLLRPGLGRGDIVRRFRRESNVLAQLRHPGIAQIHEVGVVEVHGAKRPYFSMEFVDGFTLERHADALGLGVRERIELIARVCDAVGYANEHGVIHRDLKPGNILVSGPTGGDLTTGHGDRVGTPKVLDFGIARVSDPSFETTTIETMAGQIIGTLAYMSPEQLDSDSESLDARCDVYALGAIAYELLTGQRAHQIHGLAIPEAARVIREDDPTPVTAIDKTLAGDVATIIAKAMEKDRHRRYETARELAADLRRYLSDVPIVARPTTTLYQLSRFAKRNRGLVAGFATAFVVLVFGVVGTGVSLVAALDANDELVAVNRDLDAANRDLLKTNADLTEVSQFQAAQLSGVDPSVMGYTLRDRLISTVPEPHRDAVESGLASTNFTDLSRSIIDESVLGTSRAVIDERFADNSSVRSDLLQSLAQTRYGLGLFDAAIEAQNDAVELRRTAFGARHPDTLESVAIRSQYLHQVGRYDDAIADAREVVDWRQREFGEAHAKTLDAMNWLSIALRSTDALEESYNVALEVQRLGEANLGQLNQQVIDAISNAGAVLLAVGRSSEAVPLLEEADKRMLEVFGAEDPATLGNAVDLASALAEIGRIDEAHSRLETVIEIRERSLGTTHPTTIAARSVLADVFRSASRFQDAAAVYRVVYEQRLDTLGDRHPDSLRAANNLASVLDTIGDFEGAEKLHRATLEANRLVHGDLHRDTLVSAGNLAILLRTLGENEEALALYQESADGFRDLEGPDSPYTLQAIQNYAVVLSEVGRGDEALPLYQASLEGRRRVLGAEHPATLNAIYNMGDLLRRQGDLAAAEPYCAEALELHKKVLGENSLGTCYSALSLGKLRLGQDQLAEAESLIRTAYLCFNEVSGRTHPSTTTAGEELAGVLDRLGRDDEAAALRE